MEDHEKAETDILLEIRDELKRLNENIEQGIYVRISEEVLVYVNNAHEI